MFHMDDQDFEAGVPLVRAALEGQLTVEDSEAYFEWMEVERGRVFSIWDCERARLSSLDVMKRWASWMKRDDVRERMRRNVVGLVFVVPNAAVRGGLKFIFALAPMESPMWIVREMDEAEALARQHLVAERLVTPEAFDAVMKRRHEHRSERGEPWP